ncbi:MAG: hypothetical protein HYY04_11975 [Chloroflexi bacterium]|nr:hypothetical protein [Chloroflexota bacterium]
MNTQERIVTALRGGMPDRVPWVTYTGALPQGMLERQLRNRGLGLLAHRAVYTIDRPNVRLAERPVEENGETITVRTWQTPLGELTEKRRTEPGYNSSWAIEHFVKKPRDYEILEFIIHDTTYHPDYGPFLRKQSEMGTDGLVNTAVHRMPFQRLWIEYTGLDRFLLDLHDYPELVNRVLDAMREKDLELWEVVAHSPAEFVWAPDNVTSLAMGPRLFDRYFVPYYEALGDIMHRNGKRIYCHMDGSLLQLVDCIARTPIDIIEAFTPTPTGDLSVAEARRAWTGKVLSLNFPSSVHIETPEVIAAVTRDLLRQAAPGDGFLIGITENIPDNVYARSLTAITDAIDRWGDCPLVG